MSNFFIKKISSSPSFTSGGASPFIVMKMSLASSPLSGIPSQEEDRWRTQEAREEPARGEVKHCLVESPWGEKSVGINNFA